MNPVSSYHDFMEFLQYSRDNNDKLIPIVLIKPSAMLYLNREHFLEHIFDYFDNRSGKSIQFFLPGYAHYPGTAFPHILADVRPYNEDAIALTIRRLGKIYYSEKDFIGFIEKLESGSSKFFYRGDTELVFLKYIAGEGHNLGSFDFSKLYRYNLSKIFYSQKYHGLDEYSRLHHIENFLEDVILIIREAGKNEKKLITTINSCYSTCLGGDL